VTDDIPEFQGQEIGIIFQSNTVYIVTPDYYNGKWEIIDRGTCSVRGTNIEMRLQDYGAVSGTYRLSGNTLTFDLGNGAYYVFTRTSGVNANIPPPNPGTGGNVLNGVNEAWVLDYGDGYMTGIIFKSGNKAQLLRNYGNGWSLSSEGTYYTSGGNITITFYNEPITFVYTVSGNTLLLTEDGDTEVFTRRSGITFNTPPPATGGNIVNGANEAWVTEVGSVSMGFVFKSGGTAQLLGNIGTGWYLASEGTYSTSGSNIEFTFDEMMIYGYGTYSVSGNTLTITVEGDDALVFTRTSGITISTPPTPTGGDIVNTSGQAWTYNDGSWDEGYVFNADGTVWDIGRLLGGSWQIEGQGTYEVTGANIVIHWDDYYSSSGTFSVSGSTLTLTLNGFAEILTRTNGVNLGTTPPPPPATGGNVVNGANEAWVTYMDDVEIGFVFKSGGTAQILVNTDYGWFLSEEGTYYTNGGNIEITFSGETMYGTYAASGNNLTITVDGETLVFTRTSGVTVSTLTGSNIVNGYGQAWTYNDGSWDEGYIFNADGTVWDIGSEMGGPWQIEATGTYSTHGTTIEVYWDDFGGYYEYGMFYVSGNTLVLMLEDNIETLTRTSDVYVDYYYYAPALPDGKPLFKASASAASAEKRALRASRARSGGGSVFKRLKSRAGKRAEAAPSRLSKAFNEGKPGAAALSKAKKAGAATTLFKAKKPGRRADKWYRPQHAAARK
jgi:hypothetical protein